MTDVHSPDTRIKTHTVRIGTGEWTSVIGVMDEKYLFWDNQTYMSQLGVK